jgi:uncharacterized membrane protein
MSLRFSLLGLVALVSFAGLASAALVRPGPQWLSLVVTLTVVMIIAQSLRAVLRDGESRAAAVGWLLFAVAYLALAIGPWLGSVVGPNLLSSQALNYAQVQWRKESPSDTTIDVSMSRVNLNSVYSTVVDGTSNSLIWSTSGPNWVTDVDGWVYQRLANFSGANRVPVNAFHLSGQWLTSWLAGWLGSAIAVALWRRRGQVAQDPELAKAG